jgi:hypothetical protein
MDVAALVATEKVRGGLVAAGDQGNAPCAASRKLILTGIQAADCSISVVPESSTSLFFDAAGTRRVLTLAMHVCQPK